MAQHSNGEGGQDVTIVLTTDHKDMLALIGRIKSAPGPEERRDLADTVIAEVMRHAVAEEMHVYPAIEKHVTDGAKEVERDKQEHDRVVQVMKKMEDADPSAASIMELVERLEDLLRQHASDEESDQFPKLRSGIPDEELVELGTKVETAKRLAPTRPHPGAPHSELFHKTVGPGVGMVDRLMDKLSNRRTG